MSTGPANGPSAATSTAAFGDSVFAAQGRWRTVARVVGLHLTFDHPDETPHDNNPLLLGDATEAAAWELAALLGASSDTPTPVISTEGIASVAQCLQTAAQAADIELHLGTPRIGLDGQVRLPLGVVDCDTAARLTDLVEQHLSGLYEVQEALQGALESVGVDAARMSVEDGVIVLGDIGVADGATLLLCLKPADPLLLQDIDEDDPLGCGQLADRLTHAVRTVTGGGFIDAAYTPYCRNCRTGPAILLGRLAPQDAQALTAYLVRNAA